VLSGSTPACALILSSALLAIASPTTAASTSRHIQPEPSEPKVATGLTGNTAAKATLIAEKQGVTPGGTVALALSFVVAPGWHLYWPGINDSGLQPSIKLELPAGWTAGEIQFTAPTRYVAPGDIVDHVLEGQVTLILPLTAPANAKPTDAATPLTIRGKANWLVCSEACLPGAADVSVTLAVVANSAVAKDTLDAPAFTAARTKHPKPLPTDGSIVVQPGTGSVTFSALEAIGISFYPQAESRKPTDMVSGVSTESGSLTVAFDTAEAEKPIRGVLEIVRPAALNRASSAPDAATVAAKKAMTWYTVSLSPAKTAVPVNGEGGK